MPAQLQLQKQWFLRYLELHFKRFQVAKFKEFLEQDMTKND